MIDIKLLQNNFDKVSELLQRKKVDGAMLETLKIKLANAKVKRQEMENCQALQNSLSSEFGAYKRENKDTTELKNKIDNLKEQKAIKQ